MAIARTSSGSGVGGTSHSFGNNVGDIIVLALLNTGSGATLPSTPTGYTSLTTGQDSTDGFTVKIVWKIATASNESSTPSNTTSLAWACYSGVNTTTPFTNAAGQAGTTSTINYSGIVSYTNPGDDWVITFAFVKGITGNAGSHPATSMTLPTSGEYKSGSDDVAIFDSNATLSTYSFSTKTLDAAVPWITKTAELNYATGGGGSPTNLFFF